MQAELELPTTRTLPLLVAPPPARGIESFFYDNKIVRDFGIATVVWGIIGMMVGVLAAFELAKPEINMGTAYTTFGRIRPLHTNAVIFAFVGNGIFTGVYYSLQRLCRTRMFSDVLSTSENMRVLHRRCSE